MLALKKKGFSGFFVGIDPGISGGVGIIRCNGDLVTSFRVPTIKTPKSGKTKAGNKRTHTDLDSGEICNRINDATDRLPGGPSSCIMVLERVQSTPNDGHVGAFRFGAGYGFWKGFAAGAGMKLIEVPPQTWMKAMIPLRKAGSGKEAGLDLAKKMWPKAGIKYKADSGISDALLIAEYARTHLFEVSSQYGRVIYLQPKQ